ncbi:MAG: DNA polymerase III subunit gamma/tau [Thermodesulfobacteriales bacterium]|jgi:DNA polymerase-3 subunit gamma/tau|nr:MAG: DNA polymerase III subunit gamma/tau [Thermodesulfobacteriales bacterium]
MSYVVLARKWRPKTFDDLIGQDYITQTLKNAITTGKIAHAFILSGPRGVGKTSTARIVAKALNCINGPTSDPCSNCSFCKEISEGKSLDVMEIDAASHTGVNDVREIIENIKYLPTSGKNKIYIIDEVHMLSQSAFNALLKTLEEPPPHVLFILATTEVHKIPVTILSRCQRYDFKKVSVDKIREQLASITSKEEIKIQDETLYIIAQEADGSLRDSLSLMDQLIATFGTDIKHEEALSVLGILDRTLVKSSLEGIIKKDPKFCINVLNQAIEKGISPKRFAEDLLRTLRYALLIRTCGKESITDLSEEDKTSLSELLKDISLETVESLFNLMLEGAENIQRSFYPQMALELILIKLSTLDNIVPVQDIIKKLDTLSKSMGSSKQTASRFDEPAQTYRSAPSPKQAPKLAEKIAATNIETKETAPVQAKTKLSGSKSTQDFIQFVKTTKPVIGRRLEQANEIVVEGSTVKIICETGSAESDYLKRKESETALDTLIKEFFSDDTTLHIEEASLKTPENNKTKVEQKAERKEKIKNDPVLKEAIDIFGGRVISIKPNNKE